MAPRVRDAICRDRIEGQAHRSRCLPAIVAVACTPSEYSYKEEAGGTVA
jgi:hypothetical protein